MKEFAIQTSFYDILHFTDAFLNTPDLNMEVFESLRMARYTNLTYYVNTSEWSQYIQYKNGVEWEHFVADNLTALQKEKLLDAREYARLAIKYKQWSTFPGNFDGQHETNEFHNFLCEALNLRLDNATFELKNVFSTTRDVQLRIKIFK